MTRPQQAVAIDGIFAAIETVLGISRKRIESDSRVHRVSDARMFAVVMLHRLGLSLDECAKMVGRAGHPSAHYHVSRYENFTRCDPVVRELAERINNQAQVEQVTK